jgi:hypothetical protein
MSHSPKPGGSQVESWPRLMRRIHWTDSSSKVRWATPQTSTMLLEWLEQGWHLIVHGILGSRVPLGKDSGVLKGDLVWWSWIRVTLLFEGSLVHSPVVDPGNALCYFNWSGVGQNNKRAPPVGFWWLNIPFLFPNSISWFIRVSGSCQANGESLLPSHWFLRESTQGPVSVVLGWGHPFS